MSTEGFREPDFRTVFESSPALSMVLDPDLRIIAATDAYLQAIHMRRADILGRFLFDIFPDIPADPAADSAHNCRASFQRVLQTRLTDEMPVQRRDVRKPESE